MLTKYLILWSNPWIILLNFFIALYIGLGIRNKKGFLLGLIATVLLFVTFPLGIIVYLIFVRPKLK
ncbi:hypothetical protein [Carboxydothermus hydrogenoformans]|uniref:Putative membrane protein n=1 Tax=Carboxydothermus hydrogenoformans (strain ATCC BAA-161 / DSM 6008 / Z-2901) TaxID=246194 RepID=Q3A8R8_CARHZ|nr:hypothetical protein [Carboxydothermus hydrogenoformans]ABB14865.1 putative membrane protein [Carboxydothermus hydrogenoformans Z-2901]